jgi:L-asparagine transporter-like permease
VSGPYRLLKHPLYIGNFLLVLGVLVMYYPPLWLGALYTFLFVAIYTLIVLSEIEYMKGKPERSACYRLRNLSGEVSTWVVMAVVYAIFFLLLSVKKSPNM